MPAYALQDPPCNTLTVSGNPEYPPLLFRDEKRPGYLIGAVPALLKEITEPLGVNVEVIDIGSWARVQRMARQGDLDMVAGAFITSDRIGYMDYLLPPITHLPTAVWVLKEREFAYRHWPDLVGKRGSTLINNSFGQNFDRYAEQNLRIEGVRSIEQSFQMALVDRVDYVLYEVLQGEVKLESLGIADQFVPLPTPVSREGLFFTFSKAAPCNSYELRERLADRLYEFVNSGRVDELIRRYKALYTGAG
ncbi:transporter substrate-binding domain-containing protein [Marinobacter sp. BW6]|uniref:substrate-binding periplasmic protein n=1 Tax=Marinobacter sp. BW6 TaxID=2592624 RepID=UPI0013C37018|nr:transporter substrate-binding domain-containing protein [Marinobacter sp. BW6]